MRALNIEEIAHVSGGQPEATRIAPVLGNTGGEWDDTRGGVGGGNIQDAGEITVNGNDGQSCASGISGNNSVNICCPSGYTPVIVSQSGQASGGGNTNGKDPVLGSLGAQINSSKTQSKTYGYCMRNQQ